MEGRIVTAQRHGRYFAQELMLDKTVHIREQIQDALDAGEREECPTEAGLRSVPEEDHTPLGQHVRDSHQVPPRV